MDGERFDGLTRRLATGGTTRRQLLRGLGGTGAGAVLAALGVRPTVAAKKGGGPKGPKGPKGPNGQTGPIGPVGNGGTCDDCDSVCSNCPIGCCLS